MIFLKIFFSSLNGVRWGNDVMHSGDPMKKKKKTGITSFSADVLGLRVPDESNCQLPLNTPYAMVKKKKNKIKMEGSTM